MGQGQRGHRRADAFGERAGGVESSARKHDDEFLAAIARDESFAALDRAGNRLCDKAQADVARRMAEAVIVGFEVIDVGEEQGKRAFLCATGGDGLVEPLVEFPTVGETGQKVGARKAIELVLRAHELAIA